MQTAIPGREAFLAALPTAVREASGKVDVEEAARGEFRVTGRFGNVVGREMGCRLNPCKRLCWGIVGGGFGEGDGFGERA